MKIIVLGGGLIGRTIIADLSTSFEVTCADVNTDALKNIADTFNVKTIHADLSDKSLLKYLLEPFDLVVGAVPGFMGFETLKTVIECGKKCVDISFFPEDAFELDALAKENNVTAVVDCGVAPGMCNIIAGFHNQRMQLSFYECLVGGLPVARQWPYEYKAVFSPVDVIEEYTRPARIKENGKIVVKEALSDIEQIDFPVTGTLESFNSDGLRSLLKTFSHVPDMIEKTLRYPGHASLMKILRETGFFNKEKIKTSAGEVSPLEVTSKLLFPKWKLQKGEEDLTIMRITLRGVDVSGNIQHVYTLVDRYDTTTNTTSMARTTAYTCTSAVNLLAKGLYKRKGISPPEYLGEDEKCFNEMIHYLKQRNVDYVHEVKPV